MTDTPEYSGGKTNYYMVDVISPVDERSDPYTAECQDIIEALGMDFNEGNAFKALWRRAAARLGKSKRGYTDGLYDAEKVEFYGKRLVELERRGRSEVAEPKHDFSPTQPPRDELVTVEGLDLPVTKTWAENTGAVARSALAPENQRVEPITSHSIPKPVGDGWRGEHTAQPRDLKQRVEYVSVRGDVKIGYGHEFSWDDAAWWRFARKEKHVTDPFGPRDADGWYAWNGDDTMRPAGLVFYEMRDGDEGRGEAENLEWVHNRDEGDIVKWRPA